MTGDVEDGHRITEPMLIKAIANELSVPCSDIRIKSFEVSSGSAKGDNYGCTMKAVNVEALVSGEERRLHYIAKCLPMSEARARLMIKFEMFSTEVMVYNSILPAMKNLEKCCCTTPTFPTSFYASLDEGVILMENMKLKGWYMADKLEGLTTIQLRLLLQQLARLHATSYHFLETFPGGMDMFSREFTIFTRETFLLDGVKENEDMENSIEEMYSQNFKSFINIVKEFWTGDPNVIEKLKAFNTVRKNRMNIMHKPVEEGKGINCIQHNDSWCNNFFFKNNPDGVIAEAAILDLQAMKRGRPCVDLAYLLGTSTTPEFRKDHLEEMLMLYHKELSRVFLMQGYDTDSLYPFSMFRAEFDQCFVIALGMGVLALQMFLAPPDPEDLLNVTDKDKEKGLERQKLEMVRGDDALRNRFIDFAKEAVKYGILDGL